MPPPDDLPRNAVLVLDFLLAHGRPASAYRILDALRPRGIAAPPTVYRALDRLLARGLVHRVESLNAFVACAQPDHGEDNGFAICGDCGRVAEFSGRAVHRALGAIAAAQGFELAHATIELAGRCAACRGEEACHG